jgi:hypothetical protein
VKDIYGAYSNEKPGVPTETRGCNTNPLTFVVIIWVVVICSLAGPGLLLRPLVCSSLQVRIAACGACGESCFLRHLFELLLDSFDFTFHYDEDVHG